MHGTARTAILSAWDWPPCKRIPPSPITALCAGANFVSFKPCMPTARSLKPASIAITGIPTAPAETSSSTTWMGGIIITFPIGS